ncbi:MAG: LLM class flavin-dependent oxidoreductase [Myxococcales bacterium]|nr:LLM class flavin-dependent oxidoreductase [Myxococcales bacterium]
MTPPNTTLSQAPQPPRKVRIGLGLSAFPFESARAYFRWIDLLEDRGVDSVWQTDRLISEQPFLEAMSAMAAIAGRTERIKFGMNAVVASFRDPLVLANQCATVDFLSGGRLLPVFGVGAARAPELRRTQLEAAGRGRRVDEMLTLMQRLWSEEQVDFEGEFFRYHNVTIAPRPVQKRLPCWIGGHSAAAIGRTARHGTGWLAGLRTPEQIEPIVERIHAAVAAEGTQIAHDHYGAGFPFYFGDWDARIERRAAASKALATDGFDPRRYFAVGDADTIVERCEQYVAAGVFKLVLMPIAQGDAELMQQTRRLIDEVIPRVEREI